MRLYLLQKARVFDPEKGNVEAFVTTTLNTWVKMQLRYQSRNIRRDSHKAVSLERKLVETNNGVSSLGESLIEEDGQRIKSISHKDRIEQFELREDLDYAMGTLSEDDQQMLRYIAEYGVTAAAEQYETSRRRIYRMLDCVRAQFENLGINSK